jgi:hypothetical protein
MNQDREISGAHGGQYEMTVFREVAPCSFVEIDRHLRGACCLHHQGDESQIDLCLEEQSLNMILF